jgi:hypothetical protein
VEGLPLTYIPLADRPTENSVVAVVPVGVAPTAKINEVIRICRTAPDDRGEQASELAGLVEPDGRDHHRATTAGPGEAGPGDVIREDGVTQPRNEESPEDYGYDLAHDVEAPERSEQDTARGGHHEVDMPRTVADPDGDYGYDEAHGL